MQSFAFSLRKSSPDVRCRHSRPCAQALERNTPFRLPSFAFILSLPFPFQHAANVSVLFTVLLIKIEFRTLLALILVN